MAPNVGKWNSVIGYGCGLLAAICWAVGGLLFKYVQDAGADEVQIAKCLLQYVLVLPLLSWRKERIVQADIKTNVFVLLRGAFGAAADWLHFFALQFIPLSDAVSVISSQVTLVGLFACICLKERCSILEVLLSILTFVGLVLVAQPSFLFGFSRYGSHTDLTKGILISLAGAVAMSSSIVLLRKLGPHIHFSITMLHYSWIGGIFSLISASSKGILRIPCTYDLIMVCLVAISGIIGQVFMTLGLQKEKAGHIAVLFSTEIIFALILQFVFLNYIPTTIGLIGTLIIFFSSVCLTIKRVYLQHKAVKNQ